MGKDGHTMVVSKWLVVTFKQEREQVLVWYNDGWVYGIYRHCYWYRCLCLLTWKLGYSGCFEWIAENELGKISSA